MELIDKATVVAEINRIKNTEYNGIFINDDIACCALDMAIDAINALEVKEVNLDKEIKDYFNNQPIVTRFKGTDYKLVPNTEKIAKHFFELGLYSQLSWQDVKRLAEIGETFMNSEESDNLSE